LRPRQAEEAPCLRLDVVEITETTHMADDVEQIAMLAGGRICLMCS
jgi:hypothetical protein